MRILSQVEDSVLWLAKANDLTKNNLWEAAAKQGIASDRIIFAERTELLEDHIARHQLGDLFLDTLPYNAHTTASDALWAGLPVITCAGRTFASRVAASLLKALGVPELIASSLKEYENLAIEFAKKPDDLNKIKLNIQLNKNTHAVFDMVQYVRNLESALVSVIE